jgi:hypothetical protein
MLDQEALDAATTRQDLLRVHASQTGDEPYELKPLGAASRSTDSTTVRGSRGRSAGTGCMSPPGTRRIARRT